MTANLKLWLVDKRRTLALIGTPEPVPASLRAGERGNSTQNPKTAVPARGRRPERECREDAGGERVRAHRRGLAVSPPGRSAAPSETALASSLPGSGGGEMSAHP